MRQRATKELRTGRSAAASRKLRVVEKADPNHDWEDMTLADSSHPGARLKQLRERAGLTQEECGHATELGATGYARYENDKRFTDALIPAKVIMPLVPIMVPGKGDLPVRLEELIAISEMRGVQNLLSNMTGKSAPGALQSGSEHVQAINLLATKYHVERGTFRAYSKLSSRDLGWAPFMPSRAYPQDRQWAALVNDDHGARLGLMSGTFLHCVDPDVIPMAMVPPGSVVLASVAQDSLSEVCLAVVSEYTVRGARLVDPEHKPMTGELLGVALFRYSRLMLQTI